MCILDFARQSKAKAKCKNKSNSGSLPYARQLLPMQCWVWRYQKELNHGPNEKEANEIDGECSSLEQTISVNINLVNAD
jgi:hypothetical protein